MGDICNNYYMVTVYIKNTHKYITYIILYKHIVKVKVLVT